MYVNLGDCLPCQQRAARAAARPPRVGAVDTWRPLQQHAPPLPRVMGIGQTPGAQSSAGPSFDLKRDLLAGALAVGAPYAYDKLAPKKWPKLTLVTSIASAISVYFVTVWAYGKLA